MRFSTQETKCQMREGVPNFKDALITEPKAIECAGVASAITGDDCRQFAHDVIDENHHFVADTKWF
jgi:hypothetical protein